MTTAPTKTGYADVNGVHMYYEIHGSGQPLVLIHGAFSAVDSSFGGIIPGLARSRQVVAVELQGHGRTADVDRPLDLDLLAEDVAALIRKLELTKPDVFGYSMGAGVALRVAIHHPELVRKLIVASCSYATSGLQPGMMDMITSMKPEMMHGSAWHDEYMRIAPRPSDFNRLFAKVHAMNGTLKDIPAETIRGLKAPTLVLIGDSDLTTPEHAVAMFRLLGGGVFGDMPPGLPNSQLAILPGTSHSGVASKANLLLDIVPSFLDAPVR